MFFSTEILNGHIANTLKFFKVGLWWLMTVLQYQCKNGVSLLSLNILIRTIRNKIIMLYHVMDYGNMENEKEL